MTSTDLVACDDSCIMVGVSPSLDGLPDSVRSRILLEFIGNETYWSGRKGNLRNLLRLASTSKRWAEIVYLETPGLWKCISSPSMESITDLQLATLLRNTNAREVCEQINLRWCCRLSGSGLEPIRGSTVLRRADFSFRTDRLPAAGRAGDKKKVDPDLEAIISIVESLPPFGTAPTSPSGGAVGSSGPGLLSLDLPSTGDARYFLQGYWEREEKEKKRYREAVLGLQRMFRKYYNTLKEGVGLPCPKCDQPMQFWFRSPSLHEMSVVTYCTKCHRLEDEDDEDEDEEWQGNEPDLGILEGCKTCKKDYDFGDSNVCSICQPWYGAGTTCCSDCLKLDTDMKSCSICNIANCIGCNGYDHYLDELAIHECQGCKVVACGVCRDHKRCEGHDCMFTSGINPWYCSDCDVLKKCAKCGELRCQRDGCLAACASCGDVFCHSNEYYDQRCRRELKSCDFCNRSFCRKKDCPNVTTCNVVGCGTSVCGDCKPGRMVQCKPCRKSFCKSAGCYEKHMKGAHYGGRSKKRLRSV